MTVLLGSIDLTFLAISLAKIIVLTFMVILPMVAYTVMAERRGAAIMQDRVGPNRTNLPLTLLGFKKDLSIFGMGGLLQPMADGLKFILKEDFTPKHVRTFYFWLAPALTMVPALLTCAVLPFGSELNLGFLGLAQPVKAVIADLNVGPLYTFAIASLGVYGIVLFMTALCVRLCSLTSLGAPFAAPLSPPRAHNPDLLTRHPLWQQRWRTWLGSAENNMRSRGRMRGWDRRGQ